MITDEELDNLYLLARGDIDLVERALLENLKRTGWFKKTWIIEIDDVVKYINERTKALDDLEVRGDGEEFKTK